MPLLGPVEMHSIPHPVPEAWMAGFGLAWDGEALWTGTVDAETIWKVDPDDGTELHSITPPSPGDPEQFGNTQGLTLIAGNLWQTTTAVTDETPTRGLIREIDPDDGTVVDTRVAETEEGDPTTGTATLQGGLSWDGSFLWLQGAGAERGLSKIDIASVVGTHPDGHDVIEIVEQLTAPGDDLPFGVSHEVGRGLWHTVRSDEPIRLLDPADGSVLASYPLAEIGDGRLAGKTLHSCLWDGEGLWVIDTEVEGFTIVGTTITRIVPDVRRLPLRRRQRGDSLHSSQPRRRQAGSQQASIRRRGHL